MFYQLAFFLIVYNFLCRYYVVILSNQGGINLKPDVKSQKLSEKRLGAFKKKMTFVLGRLDFPISIFAATAKDLYRKPCVGMWNMLIKEDQLRHREGIDLESSFFVGDAGGRKAEAKLKRDISCSDR